MNRDEREAELLEMRWQQIKAIAEDMEPPINKPDGGWDEAVSLILDAEFPGDDTEEAPKTAAGPQGEPKASASVGAVYPVDFFESSGIPYCEKCGAPEQRGLQGERICPVADKVCPNVN